MLCVAALPLSVIASGTPSMTTEYEGSGVLRVRAEGLRSARQYMLVVERLGFSTLDSIVDSTAAGTLQTTIGINPHGGTGVVAQLLPIGPGGQPAVADPTEFSRTLSVGNANFDPRPVGYAQSATASVVINNTGDLPTGALTVVLSGLPAAFTVSPSDLPSLEPGETTSVTVTLGTGLAVGEYSGQISVTGDPGVTGQGTVNAVITSVVQPPPPPPPSGGGNLGFNDPGGVNTHLGPRTSPPTGTAPPEVTPPYVPPVLPPIGTPDEPVRILCGCAMFEDVFHTDWFCEYVGFVASHGLFRGTDIGIFSPHMNMTRAMFVQVLANLEGVNLAWINTNTPFTDVAAGAWYTPAVAWAYQEGITQGVGGNRFAPSAPVTREEMTVLLHRYSQHRGISLPSSATSQFPDQNRVSSWATSGVTAIQGAGIVRGRDDGTFDPQATATRAEVAAIFRRFMDVANIGRVGAVAQPRVETPVAPSIDIGWDDDFNWDDDWNDGFDLNGDVNGHAHDDCDDDCDDCDDDHGHSHTHDEPATSSPAAGAGASGQVGRLEYGTDWGSLEVVHNFTNSEYTISFAFMHDSPSIVVGPNQDPWFFADAISVEFPANQWNVLEATFNGAETGNAIQIAGAFPRTVGSVMYIDNIVITNAAGVVVVDIDFESGSSGVRIAEWSEGTLTVVPMP
jgi:hypothetical protein